MIVVLHIGTDSCCSILKATVRRVRQPYSLALRGLHDEVCLLPVTDPVSTSTTSANGHVRGLHGLPVLDRPGEERRAMVRLLRLKDLVLPVDARLELAALDELYDLPPRWRTIRTPGSCAPTSSATYHGFPS